MGSYAFTTLRPQLGALHHLATPHAPTPHPPAPAQPQRVTLADVPGLVAGAAGGRGRGAAFLRHLGRASALVWVVDASGGAGPAPSTSTTTNCSRNHDQQLQVAGTSPPEPGAAGDTADGTPPAGAAGLVVEGPAAQLAIVQVRQGCCGAVVAYACGFCGQRCLRGHGQGRHRYARDGVLQRTRLDVPLLLLHKVAARWKLPSTLIDV